MSSRRLVRNPVPGVGTLFASLVLMFAWTESSPAAEPWFVPMESEAGIDDLSSAPGLYGPGIGLVDIDADGDLDVFIPNDLSGHKFYRNDGTGHFTDIAADVGLQFMAELPPVEDRTNPLEADPTSMMPCFIDTDNDGDKDFFLTGWNTYNRFFENVGGTFVDRTTESGLGIVGRSATAAWGDYNRDGELDVYIADWGGYDHLFKSVGVNRWLDVSASVGLYEINKDPQPGWSAIWFDHNRDGWPDLFVGNDYGLPNFFYVADTSGHFVERGKQYFPELNEQRGTAGFNATMGQALCDYDHDGDYDMFVANSKVNDFYRNNGGQFEDMLEDANYVGVGGVLTELKNNDIGWFCDFPDIDQDGLEDLFLVNGYIQLCVYDDPLNPPDCFGQGNQQQPNLLWMRDPDGHFSRKTDVAGLTDTSWGKSGVFADFDLDGDLDLMVTNSHAAGAPGTHKMWMNETAGMGNWLIVSLVGKQINRDAIGSEVVVRAGGETWRRLRTASTGYLSFSSPELHFGVGEAAVIDEVEVFWPDGTSDLVPDVVPNRRMTIVQGRGALPVLAVPTLRGHEAGGQVELVWEDSGAGGVDRFFIQRAADGAPGGTIGIVDVEPGREVYRFVDSEVEPGKSYRYRLTAARGDLRVQGDELAVTVGRMLRRVEVMPAAPNPFNPRTLLRYRVAPGVERVRLRIVDLRGRSVREFFSTGGAGLQEIRWDGTDSRGRAVSSGSYRFVVEADGQFDSTPLTLVR